MMCIHGYLVRLTSVHDNIRVIDYSRLIFKHSENIRNHFQCRDTIGNYNSKRYDRNTYNSISYENS